MLTRILYRVASVFFLIFTIVSASMAVICVVALANGGGPAFFFYGVWFAVLVVLMNGARKDAWRAGRYDPLYD